MKAWLVFFAVTFAACGTGMAMFTSGSVHVWAIGDWIGWAIGFALAAGVISLILLKLIKAEVQGEVMAFFMFSVPTAIMLCLWAYHVKYTMIRNVVQSHQWLKTAAEQGAAQTTSQNYLSGKVVLLDDQTLDILSLQSKLNPEMQLADPSEIGSAALINWNKNFLGNYSNGATGYQWVAVVRVYDLNRGAMSARFTITGSEPPHTTYEKGEVTGTKPSQEIIDTLQGIPHVPLQGGAAIASAVPTGGPAQNPPEATSTELVDDLKGVVR